VFPAFSRSRPITAAVNAWTYWSGRLNRKPGVYRRILLWVFNNRPRSVVDGSIEFSQADLREAAQELGLEVRNFPDLTYNLRSRAALPKDILAEGYMTIQMRGRGRYAITKDPDKIAVPDDTPVEVVPSQGIPVEIRDLLRVDEQSILSVMRYLGIVDKFLGMTCFHLQGHLRTTGSLGQQVEADEVYVAVDRQTRTRYLVPVEGKGPRERVGISQMRSTIDAVFAKWPGFPVIPLAAHLEASGHLLLMRFEVARTSNGIIETVSLGHATRYGLVPSLQHWSNAGQANAERPPLL